MPDAQLSGVEGIGAHLEMGGMGTPKLTKIIEIHEKHDFPSKKKYYPDWFSECLLTLSGQFGDVCDSVNHLFAVISADS